MAGCVLIAVSRLCFPQELWVWVLVSVGEVVINSVTRLAEHLRSRQEIGKSGILCQFDSWDPRPQSGSKHNTSQSRQQEISSTSQKNTRQMGSTFHLCIISFTEIRISFPLLSMLEPISNLNYLFHSIKIIEK